MTDAQVADVPAIDVLTSMLGYLIERGTEPGYMRVSQRVLDVTGWWRLVHRSDIGGDYFMGMRVTVVDADVLVLGGAPLVDQDQDEVLPVQPFLHDGRAYFRMRVMA